MKKCINLIYLVLISSSLNGMLSNAPDVTQWKEICKNPEKKQQLTTIYKDFCKKRVQNNGVWTIASLTPFVCKPVRNNVILCGLAGLFALRQTYLFSRNTYLNQLATREDLSYLNHDVLEELGNPKVEANDEGKVDGKGRVRGRYSVYDYPYEYKNIFGCYYRPLKKYTCQSVFSIREIDGIKEALSGKYKTERIRDDFWTI
ncbi:MAG TPA: hypothetical protein VKU36_04070 [Candidatus Babeliales bacterium]|nr:hypothetical protein [Candidatus Babeliales bacterium]